MKFIAGLIFSFFIYFQSYSQTSPYENLVFEGAGIRGIAYSGAIKKLGESGILTNIKKVGGTSAGAITAMMLSLGYTDVEIYKIVSESKFHKFNDGRFFFIGGISRMKKNYGWYRAKSFNKWLEKIILAKTDNADLTFAQLKEKGFKELYVTGTCLNKQKMVVFSAETYPNMKVKDAVQISMSIPMYFQAVFIDQNGKVYKKPTDVPNLDVMVDGGIIAEFPIFLFDEITTDSKGIKTRIPNPKTLGVRIDTEHQVNNDRENLGLHEIPINNFTDYLTAFYTIIIENLNRNQLIPEDWDRTISVSSEGISPKIKRLSKAQTLVLTNSGEVYTEYFLRKHNFLVSGSR